MWWGVLSVEELEFLGPVRILVLSPAPAPLAPKAFVDSIQIVGMRQGLGLK